MIDVGRLMLYSNILDLCIPVKDDFCLRKMETFLDCCYVWAGV